eukprot:scaffold32970_cov14-Prasinocladus_malaysianus.AAC.1
MSIASDPAYRADSPLPDIPDADDDDDSSTEHPPIKRHRPNEDLDEPSTPPPTEPKEAEPPTS